MSREIFSRNLVHFREAMGLETHEMAKKLNVEHPSYRSWEIAIAYPKMNTLISLCDFLKYKDLYKLVTEKIDAKEIKQHVEKNIFRALA